MIILLFLGFLVIVLGIYIAYLIVRTQMPGLKAYLFLIGSLVLIVLGVIASVVGDEITTPNPPPGFGALIALIGLGAVAFLVVRKH